METDLLRWIIFLPLIGAVLNGVLIRSKNPYLSGGLGSLAALGAFAVSCSALIQHGFSSHLLDNVFTWFSTGTIKVEFALESTAVTAVMLLVVTGIGSLIHIYATSYMSHDESPWRFFCYLNLFLAAMLSLILSRNLVGVFLGWEGVGLCSYLLIGYWYKDHKNTAAGMKAFVTNRIGDLGFLLALFVAIRDFGTLNISEILAFVSNPAQNPVSTLSLILFAGGVFWASTGKSAQFPLYVWLPDAMAGPTPVSALIHAATMVTSGVFVILRLWPVYASLPGLLDTILVIGVFTAWLAALIALTQRDIKKVLAYSTVSQLGFMFTALGVGAPVAAFFHVVTHACFKALLFLGAGSVIHGMHEKQDLFEMGGLRKKMKVTHLTFLIGTLAIIGFPLTSGFFSKDLILEKAFVKSPIVFFVMLGAALLTAFYMLRAYTLAFWGSPKTKEADHAHESHPIMLAPLCVLALLSVVVGFFEVPDILGGIHLFKAWVENSWIGFQPLPSIDGHEVHHLSHAMEWFLVFVTSIASLSVAYFSWKKFQNPSSTQKAGGGIFFRLSENKFYVDEVYNVLVLKPLARFAAVVWRVLDIGFINGTLHGIRGGLSFSGNILSLFHTGSVQTYAWYLAFAAAISIILSVAVF